MSRKKIIPPGRLNLGFVADFQNDGCAIVALTIIADQQKQGLGYKDILNYPGFCGLFKENFLIDKNKNLLVIKLKNTVRDFRDSKNIFDDELTLLQHYFRNKKRKP